MFGYAANFPLGAVAEPFFQEVEKFTGVHGDENFGFAGIWKYIAGIFITFFTIITKSTGEIIIGGGNVGHDLLIILDGIKGLAVYNYSFANELRRYDIVERAVADIALAAL